MTTPTEALGRLRRSDASGELGELAERHGLSLWRSTSSRSGRRSGYDR